MHSNKVLEFVTYLCIFQSHYVENNNWESFWVLWLETYLVWAAEELHSWESCVCPEEESIKRLKVFSWPNSSDDHCLSESFSPVPQHVKYRCKYRHRIERSLRINIYINPMVLSYHRHFSSITWYEGCENSSRMTNSLDINTQSK